MPALWALLVAFSVPPAQAACSEETQSCEDICRSDPDLDAKGFVEKVFWEVAEKAGLGNKETKKARDPVTGRVLKFYYIDSFGVGFDCKTNSPKDGDANAMTTACKTYDAVVFGGAVCGMSKNREELAYWMAHELSHIVLSHNELKIEEFGPQGTLKFCKYWADGPGKQEAAAMQVTVNNEVGAEIQRQYPDVDFDNPTEKDLQVIQKVGPKAQKLAKEKLFKKLYERCLSEYSMGQEQDADDNAWTLLSPPEFDRKKARKVFKTADDFLSELVQNRKDDLHSPLALRDKKAGENYWNQE